MLSQNKPDPAQPKMAEGQSENLPGLPDAAQADQARELAAEQRKLRDELARSNEALQRENAMPLDDSSLAKILEQQKAIARAAQELAGQLQAAKDKAPQQIQRAQQAASAANQGHNELRNGEIKPALISGQQVARNLQQLAQGTLEDARKKQTQKLAEEQEDLNKKLMELEQNTGAIRAQQQRRSQELRDQTQALQENIDQFMKNAKSVPGAGTDKETESSLAQLQKATEELKKAQIQNRQGAMAQAQASQERAADALAEASKNLTKAAEKMARPTEGMEESGNLPATEAVESARESMSRANTELQNGQQRNASEAMSQAASSLSQAHRELRSQLSRSNQGQRPGTEPGSALGGSSKTDVLPKDLSVPGLPGQKFTGKSWGDIPGEIKTQILEEAKTRYGSDYARYIKLYFEQLAQKKSNRTSSDVRD